MLLFVYVPISANRPGLEVIVHLEHDITVTDQNDQPRRTQRCSNRERIGRSHGYQRYGSIQIIRAYKELYTYGLPPIEPKFDCYTTT